MYNRYSGLFDGVDLLKAMKVKLSIDPNVNSYVQLYRRVPFGLRAKGESEVREFLDMDIIEAMSEPSQWVSPVVIVPKLSKDIRHCVDMQSANEAVIKARHSLPMVDEMLLCYLGTVQGF